MNCPECNGTDVKTEEHQGVTYFECMECDYHYPETERDSK